MICFSLLVKLLGLSFFYLFLVGVMIFLFFLKWKQFYFFLIKILLIYGIFIAITTILFFFDSKGKMLHKIKLWLHSTKSRMDIYNEYQDLIDEHSINHLFFNSQNYQHFDEDEDDEADEELAQERTNSQTPITKQTKENHEIFVIASPAA